MKLCLRRRAGCRTQAPACWLRECTHASVVSAPSSRHLLSCSRSCCVGFAVPGGRQFCQVRPEDERGDRHVQFLSPSVDGDRQRQAPLAVRRLLFLQRRDVVHVARADARRSRARTDLQHGCLQRAQHHGERPVSQGAQVWHR